jgi:hypothetical protein
MEKKLQSAEPQVQTLARTFTENLMKYGRLHEGTLIRKYYTRTNIRKFFDLIPLGRKMLKTKRLQILPKRIKARESLARIIRKAQEIDMRVLKGALEYAPEFVGYRGLGEMKLEQRKGE